MEIQPGDVIKYSSAPDYSDDYGDPEWETGLVIAQWPGKNEMMLVWWFETRERTCEHLHCVRDDSLGCYRFVGKK